MRFCFVLNLSHIVEHVTTDLMFLSYNSQLGNLVTWRPIYLFNLVYESISKKFFTKHKISVAIDLMSLTTNK